MNGVGYVVHCSARTLQALPPTGDPVSLAIETHVREDQIRLFGFTSDIEREWFRLLQTVQGVGAKVALAVLSTLLLVVTYVLVAVAAVAFAVGFSEAAFVGLLTRLGGSVAG